VVGGVGADKKKRPPNGRIRGTRSGKLRDPRRGAWGKKKKTRGGPYNRPAIIAVKKSTPPIPKRKVQSLVESQDRGANEMRTRMKCAHGTSWNKTSPKTLGKVRGKRVG